MLFVSAVVATVMKVEVTLESAINPGSCI